MLERGQEVVRTNPMVQCHANPLYDSHRRMSGMGRDRVETTTGVREIVCRRWLLIDFDIQRPVGISSTEAEHEAALAKASGPLRHSRSNSAGRSRCAQTAGMARICCIGSSCPRKMAGSWSAEGTRRDR
jgi:hypothetical protein